MGRFISPDRNGYYIYLDDDPINKHILGKPVGTSEFGGINLPDGYLSGMSLIITNMPGQVSIHGHDEVFDFKHLQRATFEYVNNFVTLNTTILGGEVNFYDGLIWGFDKGEYNSVNNYKGPFVSVGAGVGLVGGKYWGISGSGSFFSSANDNCQPDLSMWGFVESVTPGAGIALPVSGCLYCTRYWIVSSITQYANASALAIDLRTLLFPGGPLRTIAESVLEREYGAWATWT